MFAFVSDFDGTITEDDFFTLISKEYFTEDMLKPWREYLKGKKTHFNALKEMFSQIHLDERVFTRFIKNIKFDKKFFKVCELCNKRNIPIYICSAGCSYYINVLIGKKIREYEITLITNHGEYSKENGLVMTPPLYSDPYYDEQTGISKSNIIEHLHRRGYQTVFAGDGLPDIEPARIANFVFARSVLLENCKKEEIATQEFNNFGDIYKFIDKISKSPLEND